MAKRELMVHLRVYRGKELSYDAQGSSKNENHLVHIHYDTPEWKRYLAHLMPNGIIKATVEKVLDLNDVNKGKTKEDADYYKSIEDFKDIQKEVNASLTTSTTVELTQEQKEIAELKEQVKALLAIKENPATPATPATANLENKEVKEAKETSSTTAKINEIKAGK